MRFKDKDKLAHTSIATGMTLALLVTIFLSLTACTGIPIDQAKGKPYKNTASRYTIDGETYYDVLPSSSGYLEIGVASWYGSKFHGRLTANGETYDMYEMTAAHKTLPLPTWVKVTNLDNGKKVVLKVNDRGPFHDNRLIDLSWKAATKLGFADHGTAPVVVEALIGEPKAADQQILTQQKSNTPNYLVDSQLVDSQAKSIATYYLQIGAFSKLQSAQYLQRKINFLIGRHDILDVGVRILQSEATKKILHKVWIGPIRDESKRDQLALWVEEMNLGYPIPVDVK